MSKTRKKVKRKRSPASKKRRRKPLRDRVDPYDLLYDIELDLYLECMELDKKRKKRDYIV